MKNFTFFLTDRSQFIEFQPIFHLNYIRLVSDFTFDF